MADDDGLFDLPDGVAEPSADLTRGEQRRRTVELRIAAGQHPLAFGGRRLTPHTADECIAEGLRCGDCAHRVLIRHRSKTYPKCDIPGRYSASEASDVRAWWPACRDHQPKETP